MIDYRPKMFPAYDQSQAESGCEPNAAAQIFQYLLPAPEQKKPWYGWSRAAISAVRDQIDMRRAYPDPVERTIEAVNFYGLLTEEEWHTTEENGNKMPPLDLFHSTGRTHKFNAAKMAIIPNQVKHRPLLLRMLTCKEFRDVPSDGIMAPQVTEIGRNPHQVVLAGKRDDGRFIILNSWGTGWGDKGCIYIRPEELDKLIISLWSVTLVKE